MLDIRLRGITTRSAGKAPPSNGPRRSVIVECKGGSCVLCHLNSGSEFGLWFSCTGAGYALQMMSLAVLLGPRMQPMTTILPGYHHASPSSEQLELETLETRPRRDGKKSFFFSKERKQPP